MKEETRRVAELVGFNLYKSNTIVRGNLNCIEFGTSAENAMAATIRMLAVLVEKQTKAIRAMQEDSEVVRLHMNEEQMLAFKDMLGGGGGSPKAESGA